MRLLIASAVFALLAGPACAQIFAIDQRVPLKMVAATEDVVSLAQIPAFGQAPTGPFDAWVWTFTREPQLSGSARFDGSAVLTRFDCRAGTRQRMRYEFYIGEIVVNDSAYDEAPSRPAAGSLDTAAFQTVCDPAFNPDMEVRMNGARGARQPIERWWRSLTPSGGGLDALNRR